jgi:fructose-1,6-bisphosphatase/sedoheptulose 1,7-bisphosphatase-like protein
MFAPLQLAVGPSVNPRAVSLNRSTRSNIQAVAEAQGERVSQLVNTGPSEQLAQHRTL